MNKPQATHTVPSQVRKPPAPPPNHPALPYRRANRHIDAILFLLAAKWNLGRYCFHRRPSFYRGVGMSPLYWSYATYHWVGYPLDIGPGPLPSRTWDLGISPSPYMGPRYPSPLATNICSGMRGTCAPLGVQILLILCSFWENLAKSYVGAPPRELAPPPRGNPGSATDLVVMWSFTWEPTPYLPPPTGTDA